MKNYEPMEIIICRPCNYVGAGNYQQKITICSDKTEKEILEILRNNDFVAKHEVIDIEDRRWQEKIEEWKCLGLTV